jgi:murein DD-endopeptidase MepM/ murein hydrolase activator NlpD
MKLAHAVVPVSINQAFGANPAYYAKFLDANGNPEKGHMGVDFMAGHGQPVYAPHDGFAFYVTDAHGGDGVYLRFEDEDVSGKWWTVILWHLCAKGDPQYAPRVDTIGRQVKKGDLLGFADNTGAPFESSGDHLHFGLVPCDQYGTFLYPGNGFGGCVNPLPYFDGSSAAPVPKPPPIEADPTEGLSASDRLAVYAAQAQASGNTKVESIYRAIIALLKSFSLG